ncbi:Nitroreductase [Alkalispirochaeta americana]|uniref:Nitroreductase n=1 Tax=Alkalispirochaeta americana TaxID=159291 RepID=A0A1N6WW88_9SPIO|nr:nitroreductase family protein [Alkalispirochaeta americana]SIQ94281.1 Nitroreductase [Alkalispirochaeta americana]
MDYFHWLRTRRTIRKYTETPICESHRAILEEAALRAPSSRSLRPWEFISVTDSRIIHKLSRVKVHGSAFLAEAPYAMVIIADPRTCDVWIEDCAIAAWTVQSAAENLGLGSCWIQLRNRSDSAGRSSRDALAEVLDIPPHYDALAIIAVGHPAESPLPHPETSLLREKIHLNRFGNQG